MLIQAGFYGHEGGHELGDQQVHLVQVQVQVLVLVLVLRQVQELVQVHTCFWLGLSLATSDRALPAVCRQDTTSFSTWSTELAKILLL